MASTKRQIASKRLSDWHWSVVDLDAAEEQAVKCARAFCYTGRRVEWLHGSHVRSGIVIDNKNGIHGAYQHCRVLIESEASGKRFWLPVYFILQYERARLENHRRAPGGAERP